ncbi:MAG: dihydrofolate reductase family protein [Salinibacterium sp.]|nr:dihydrofolate reductase family protein [Salinibacterium sp.]
MILRRVHPDPVESVELDSASSRERLLELYQPESTPWLRLNLVTSVSGSAAGSDGTSETLTSTVDRLILGVIRELADVVLVGAESVRAEGYLRPKRAPLAVVTGSGNLEGHRIDSGDAVPPVVVLCPATAVDRVSKTLGPADVIVVPDSDGHMAPHDIIGALRKRRFASIVCEGGPGLARQLIVAGLVDEVCLTTSPRLTGLTLPLFGTESFAEVKVSLSQLLVDDESSLYARWAVARDL